MEQHRAESQIDPLLDRILSDKQICTWLGIGRSTLWRLSKSDDFPKKIKISAGRGGRIQTELRTWIEARKKARAFDKDGAQWAMTRPEFPQPDNMRLISVKDACGLLGVSKQRVHQMMDEGQVKYAFVGEVRYPIRAHLEKMVKFDRKLTTRKSASVVRPPRYVRRSIARGKPAKGYRTRKKNNPSPLRTVHLIFNTPSMMGCVGSARMNLQPRMCPLGV